MLGASAADYWTVPMVAARSIYGLGTLIPRLWSNNKRVFWRDLHAVPGFYGVLLVGFPFLQGCLGGFWGETFAQCQFPAQMSDKVPQSTNLQFIGQHGHVVPWAVERLPMPQSRYLWPHTSCRAEWCWFYDFR